MSVSWESDKNRRFLKRKSIPGNQFLRGGNIPRNASLKCGFVLFFSFFLLLRNTDEAGEIFFKKTDENDKNKKREEGKRRDLFIFLFCFGIEQNCYQRD